MTIKDLMEKYHMSRKDISDKFGIPYRTVQNWAMEDGGNSRKCPDYVLNMMDTILLIESSK